MLPDQAKSRILGYFKDAFLTKFYDLLFGQQKINGIIFLFLGNLILSKVEMKQNQNIENG